MKKKFLSQKNILIFIFFFIAGCVALMDPPSEECEADFDCDFGELCFEYNKGRQLCYAANLCDEHICECSTSSYYNHCPTGYFCYEESALNNYCQKNDWCLQNVCDCYVDSDCPEGYYCYRDSDFNRACMPGTGS